MAPPDATATQARWRRARAGVWDDPRRFSWLRCLIVVATYTLLCSDVLRSGVGLRSLDQFPTLQPNLYLAFGPWGYPVNTVWANSTDDDTAAEWAYKFDSTSIAWRACTQHWNLTSWPSCLLYNGTCPSPTIPAVTLLRMMDDLITHAASADGSLLSRARDAPSMFVLRARYKIQDRVHDHVFPQWFLWSGMTTVQATYYAPNQIAASKASRPFDPCAWVDSQPQYCFGPWPSFPHDISGALMPASSYISTDIARRLQTWQEQFPTSIIDLLILSQSSDPDASRDSASYTSTTIFDVSTIIRVRTCDSGGCRTLVMDDHRYEGGEYSTDVIEWLPVASSLRWSAQVYFLVRLVGAYVGCFIARRQEDTYVDANVLKVGVAALRTMMQLPCQSVVWGSPIPVVFYALAHTIDAPMVYRVLYEKFSTMEGGEVAFNMWQAGWLCAIQMRNIWLLGLAAQVIVWFQTSKSWSSGRGVCGLPRFSLAIISACTLAASYRSLSFRCLPVYDVKLVHTGRALRSTVVVRGPRASLNNGVGTDIKFCLAVVLVVLAITIIVGVLIWAAQGFEKVQMHSRSLVTPVPYSAGVLWPTCAFTIACSSNLFPCAQRQQTGCTKWWLQWLSKTSRRIRVSVGPAPQLHSQASWPADPHERRQFAKRQLELPHERRDDTYAVVALMNLVAMTDPWTWVKLRMGAGQAICYLRHRQTGAICCLPSDVINGNDMDSSLSWSDFEMVYRTTSSEMSWCDLLHCG